MSTYTTFAIWGAGNLGSLIATHLLRQQTVSVTILSRPESKDSERNRELSLKGAIIKPYDVNGADSTSGIEGIEVLILTTGFGGLHLRSQMLRAAHAAGVKLFVPGPWGDYVEGREHKFFQPTIAMFEEAGKLGVSTAAFFTGSWLEGLLAFGFNLKEGKITIHGEGNAPVSVISVQDIASFAAHVLATLPPSQLENAKFQIEGDRLTFNKLAEGLQKKSGNPFEIVHLPRATLEQKLEENPYDLAAILLGWDTGKGALPGPLSNGIWPEWKPKTAVEALTPFLA